MPDERSLIEKLEAMAGQTASPAEAEAARRMLERLHGARARAESPGRITREAVMRAPDRATTGKTMTFRTSSGVVYTIDVDEWELHFAEE